jgi:hypothetical protein
MFSSQTSSCPGYERRAAHGGSTPAEATSGYAASALGETALPGDLEVLGKPYQPDELAQKLRLVINRKHRAVLPINSPSALGGTRTAVKRVKIVACVLSIARGNRPQRVHSSREHGRIHACHELHLR